MSSSATPHSYPRVLRAQVTLYEIPSAELPPLLLREARLQAERVNYVDEEGNQGEAILFTTWSHEGYRRSVSDCKYEEEVGQYYQGMLYRTDVLPVMPYLQDAIEAYRAKGPEYLTNLLESSFLGDGETTIAQYMERARL